MNQIKDYAEALKDRLEACQELATPHLKLHYSQSWFTDEYGHRHLFTIRKGDRTLDNYFGEKMLTGTYFDRHLFGAGKHIYVRKKPQFEIIKGVVERLNRDTSLDFMVRFGFI